VSIGPLLIISIVDYKKSKEAMESEVLMRTSRFTSNAWRTVSFFLTERLLALDLIVQDNTYEQLCDPPKLKSIKENLRNELSGFIDLGVIDSNGIQHTYVGPYDLQGVNYKEQEWFAHVLDSNLYISDVFLGFRNVPHFVIAVKHAITNGSFYILRATLDMERFSRLLTQLEISGQGDAFIVNRKGLLQTPSRHYGQTLQQVPLKIPSPSDKTEVIREIAGSKEPLIIGYRYIPDTPFVLMVVKKSDVVMKEWFITRIEIIGFLALSITLILVVIFSMATYLVKRIYLADKRRLSALHKVEYSNKMAALGRLSAGVAHEINNPLAVINEKAGLIKDLFRYGKKYKDDPKLIDTIDSITSSVDRCATITKRLLSFAKPEDGNVRTLNLRTVVEEVIGFMGKEAEYRNIQIEIDIPDDVLSIQSDRGKLQQILLNLVNNAFAAMDNEGRLEVKARRAENDDVMIAVTDNGIGMSEEERQLVFEPFYSTKTEEGGTGLGLSITYNLVQELGGKIRVESEKGVGTSFMFTLPLNSSQQGGTKA
jgi:signal transduction histidine kinase